MGEHTAFSRQLMLVWLVVTPSPYPMVMKVAKDQYRAAT